MSYQTYTTKALVCGSKDSNTADRSYLLFTERAGMVWATAKSVRSERSKQRYALQDFSLLRVSLVKGKSGWRIGSVEAHGNPFLNAADRQERAQVQQIVRLLRRLVHGEEPIPAVYADTMAALALVFADDAPQHLSDWFVLRVLAHLGYVSETTVVASLHSEFSEVVMHDLPRNAARLIEQGLSSSHL